MSCKNSSLMPLKSILREIQDIKGGLGSISRRSFEVRLPYHHRSRSHSVVLDETPYRDVVLQQSRWANMPPELLRDVIQRLETSENTWPSRKHVVACAAVCTQWREIAKELVKTPEQSGKLTFPISLKQPGPRDATMQCFIKRDRATSTYYLCLGLSPNLVENGKFLLAARKFRRATTTDYIISLHREDFSRGSTTYVGKLRSNFLGTKFTIYDSQPPHLGAVLSNSRAGRRFGSKQISPRVPAGSFNVAHIAYELNVLGTRGPRRMQVILHSIPSSAVEPGGFAPTPTEFSNSFEDSHVPVPVSKSKAAVSDCSTADLESFSGVISKDSPLVLKNKAPRWHEQLQCWCLNFRGRVTVASVKNFQLVAALEPGQHTTQADHDKVLLQFGKIGKDMFTMDYRYPLSAFQASGADQIRLGQSALFRLRGVGCWAVLDWCVVYPISWGTSSQVVILYARRNIEHGAFFSTGAMQTVQVQALLLTNRWKLKRSLLSGMLAGLQCEMAARSVYVHPATRKSHNGACLVALGRDNTGPLWYLKEMSAGRPWK